MDSFAVMLLHVQTYVAMLEKNASAVYPLLSNCTSVHVLSSCFQRAPSVISSAPASGVSADHNGATGAVWKNCVQPLTVEREKKKAGQTLGDSTSLGNRVCVRYRWCMYTGLQTVCGGGAR